MRTIVALILMLQGTAPAATRPGVVVGRLQTSAGGAAAAIRVSAVPAPPPTVRPSDGQEYYSTPVPVSTALTDANGRYRLGNLAPGRYFIVATVFSYSTFYPDTTNPDSATVVTVGAGAPVEGIDFTVLMPPGGRVSGHVNTPPLEGPEKAIVSGLALGDLLEAPVAADGSFTFGHLPRGTYFLSLFPAPPGMPSRAFTVGETDTRIELVRPALRTIRGRVVVPLGPIPYAVLGFSTDSSYVDARINADGTFQARVQPGRHQVEVAGLPSGYSMSSVRLGSQDVSKGLVVGADDISGLLVTIAARARLPRLRGAIVGVPSATVAGARVELTGRVIGTLEARVGKDGAFEFPAVTPGTYQVRVPTIPNTMPTYVVVGWDDVDVQLRR